MAKQDYTSWRYRYVKHRGHAKQQGIRFLLTFGEWCAIWRNSGRWHQCGTHAGQYVMARYGDKGAYEWGNVRICTVEENHAEWDANNRQLLIDRMLDERNPNVNFVMTDARKAQFAAQRGKVLPPSTRAAMKATHARRWAAMSSEERIAMSAKLSAGLRANWTPRMSEQRGINIKNWWATFTPEERSAHLKQSWATRKGVSP